jgi:hypothetical protein
MADLRGVRALITGASGGIGAAIARELARRGADLVLTARRAGALAEIAASCPGVAVDTVVADLGAPGGAEALWQAATAGGKPVHALVNNAGFGYFRPYTEIDRARDAELVQLNVISVIELTKRFVAARRGEASRGYVLNVASIAAYQAVPNMALYGASKAFVRNFTEALHDELRGTPLSATVVCPGGTRTDFHAMAGAGNYGAIANASMMSAEDVARIAVRGMLRGKRVVVPGVLNKLACWSVRLAPRRVNSWAAKNLMGKPRAGELPARAGGAS